jgi:transposase
MNHDPSSVGLAGGATMRIYSRLLWLRFYPRQTLTTVIAGVEEAFAYFGGVPEELLFDQMKAVVLEDARADGGKLLENPEFLRFARHWGFRIRVSAVARRPRARWSGPCATCAAISSMDASA